MVRMKYEPIHARTLDCVRRDYALLARAYRGRLYYYFA